MQVIAAVHGPTTLNLPTVPGKVSSPAYPMISRSTGDMVRFRAIAVIRTSSRRSDHSGPRQRACGMVRIASVEFRSRSRSGAGRSRRQMGGDRIAISSRPNDVLITGSVHTYASTKESRMIRTPTTRSAHCSAHATHRGACAGCQRARIAAARQQLALASTPTVASSAFAALNAPSIGHRIAA